MVKRRNVVTYADIESVNGGFIVTTFNVQGRVLHVIDFKTRMQVNMFLRTCEHRNPSFNSSWNLSK